MHAVKSVVGLTVFMAGFHSKRTCRRRPVSLMKPLEAMHHSGGKEVVVRKKFPVFVTFRNLGHL